VDWFLAKAAASFCSSGTVNVFINLLALWVEIDEVHRLVFPVTPEDVEVVAVIKRAHVGSLNLVFCAEQRFSTIWLGLSVVQAVLEARAQYPTSTLNSPMVILNPERLPACGAAGWRRITRRMVIKKVKKGG
jgi:hypothetical protein